MRHCFLVAIGCASLLTLSAGCSTPEDDPPLEVVPTKDKQREVIHAPTPAAQFPAAPAVGTDGKHEVIVRARYHEDKVHFDFEDAEKKGHVWKRVGTFKVLDVVKGTCDAKAFEVMANTSTFAARGFEQGLTYTLRIRLTEQRTRELPLENGSWPDYPRLHEYEIERVKDQP